MTNAFQLSRDGTASVWVDVSRDLLQSLLTHTHTHPPPFQVRQSVY